MPRNSKIAALLVVLSTLGVMTKLFTEEIFLRDEPTVAVRLRALPSLESFALAEGLVEPGRLVLLRDENDYIGSGVYRSLVGWGWLVLPLLTVGYIGASRRRRSKTDS